LAHTLNGTFTIKEVLQITNTKYRSRFRYAKRDKIYSTVKIQKIKVFDPDRDTAPLIKYQVSTTSKPHYKPYRYKQESGKHKGRTRQRRILHTYDIVFEITRLSINEKNWVIRLGSGKTWKKPPQKKVKTIYSETRKKWSKEQIEKHKRKKNLYLDIGDYNSRERGINADFLFRCSYVYKKNGHLFGRQYGKYANIPPSKTNKQQIMFFPKHLIVFIELLMKKGILKND